MLGTEPNERGCFGHAATWVQELCARDNWGSSGACSGQEEPSIHIPPACPGEDGDPGPLPAPVPAHSSAQNRPVPQFPRLFNGLAALTRAAAPRQSWKSRTSQIFSLDKVAINQKSCPSPFQFSQCLPGWGTEAPRRVSSLPLITFASNEAARRGRGSSQPSSCRTGSASHRGRDAAPGLSPRLHSQILKKISTQLRALRYCTP